MSDLNKLSSLTDLLAGQMQAVCDLEVVLQEETQAIANRKSADIQECAKRKLQLLNLIQQHDALISRNPELSTIKDEQQDEINAIKQQLTTCQHINEANGAALQRAHLSMHKLRNLFQEATGRFEMTYDAGGQASGSKTLGTNVKA
ncbi:flagella synthesis protein FlgN [Veronia pacifica]|uniref:Flagellar biosynthesis protein FlgN n=1 Tax=Veronia pacifica TaxID=1080227 RepID=A0A1C3EEP6_9GAMM|nr:flagellar export chaperone FlgN [Veronia pacifica]ODA31706.1 flagellar biosynthesis protein FlgN [Veronia pacifica]